ncbi:MAG: hypothetical protein Kow0090_21030 [Myxococcota bacterium]
MSGEKILVVDDDKEFLEVISAVLSEKNYRVVTASNSDEGFKLLDSEFPDLVVMDLSMRERNEGLKAIEEMRHKRTGEKKIPIVIVSATTPGERVSREAIEDRVEAVGADMYFDKPVNWEKFTAGVKTLLRESKL